MQSRSFDEEKDMGTQAKLKAQPRQESGKSAVRKMRAGGRIPAVVYGHGDETRSISVDAHEIHLLFKRVHYENTIVEIDIEGEKAPVKTLVREVQSHAYRPQILHVDFQQVHAGEMIHVDVPIRLNGTPAGVRAGGVLMQPLTDLPLRVLPDRIPESIEIDVSELGINESIHMRDITLPEGVQIEVDADRTVCTVTPPTVPTTTGEEAEPAPTEPEVIGREEEE
jgi:large subunit ribosomal protein L25